MTSQTQVSPKNGLQNHDGVVNGAGEGDSTCTSDSMSIVDQHPAGASGQSQGMFNALLSSQSWLARLFASHPKLLIFFGLNLAITGVPLIVFTVFALSVGLSTLAIGVTIGLLGAGMVTVTCVGFALTILIPIICLTTCVACSLAFWILAGLYVVQWVLGPSDRTSKDSSAVPDPVDKSHDLEVGQWSTEFRQIVSARKETS